MALNGGAALVGVLRKRCLVLTITRCPLQLGVDQLPGIGRGLEPSPTGFQLQQRGPVRVEQHLKMLLSSMGLGHKL